MEKVPIWQRHPVLKKAKVDKFMAFSSLSFILFMEYVYILPKLETYVKKRNTPKSFRHLKQIGEVYGLFRC